VHTALGRCLAAFLNGHCELSESRNSDFKKSSTGV
jgi:hypothetical protein